MPKLKKPYNRNEDLQKLIYGSMGLMETRYQDVADVWGCCRQTATTKIKDPDTMTLGEARKLCRHLGITAEQFREALKF